MMLAQLGMTSQASLQRRSYPPTRGSNSSVSTIEPPWSCLISFLPSFYLFHFVCSPRKPDLPSLHRSHPIALVDGSSMSIFETTEQYPSLPLLKEP